MPNAFCPALSKNLLSINFNPSINNITVVTAAAIHPKAAVKAAKPAARPAVTVAPIAPRPSTAPWIPRNVIMPLCFTAWKPICIFPVVALWAASNCFKWVLKAVFLASSMSL